MRLDLNLDEEALDAWVGVSATGDAVARLRETRRAMVTLLRHLPGMVYRCRNDRSWTMEFVSGHCATLTGYAPEDLIGNRTAAFGDLIHLEDRLVVWRQVQAALREGRDYQITYRIISAAGDEKWVWEQGGAVRDAVGALVALEGVILDITEQRRTEEHLRQNQRLELLGVFAGGVAHDFNNLLSVILSFTSFAAEGLPEGSRARDDLGEVIAAGRRAADLTRQLLVFSREQPVQPRVVDLNALVLRTDRMLRRILGEDVELISVPGEGLWSSRVDPGQLEQVLLNLAANARHAMPDGGTLAIELANTTLGDVEAPGQLPAGDYVRLTVRDTGHGMDEATLDKIFEPFFTTKDRGEGTGLGLSICLNIVRQAGGHIGVESRPGAGTRFEVLLPRVDAALDPVEVAATANQDRGRETILIVEDEPTVRALVVRSLSRRGYTVLEAENGDDALRVCAQTPGAIDLLLSDVVMPHIGGPELFRRLAERYPRMCVLYMSGYAPRSDGGGDPVARSAFLPKPFAPPDLVRKVREVLDAASES